MSVNIHFNRNPGGYELINNLETEIAGVGALDAAMGKKLSDKIHDMQSEKVVNAINCPNGFKDIRNKIGRNVLVFCDKNTLDMPNESYFTGVVMGYGLVNHCYFQDNAGTMYTRVYYDDAEYDTGWIRLETKKEIFSLIQVTNCTIRFQNCTKIGNIIHVVCQIQTTIESTGWIHIASIPEGYRPSYQSSVIVTQSGTDDFFELYYNASGIMNVHTKRPLNTGTDIVIDFTYVI